MTDTRHWLDRMMHDGRWGEAYAHWIGTLDDMAAGIPALHNGDFESPLEDLGFGWRRERISGVFFQLEDDPSGTAGRVAHLHFLGRSTATAGLAHPLLLAPGRYRMSFRARSEYLRSEQGLVWQVACAANDGPPLGGVGTLVDGDGWRDLSVTFDVPDVGCTAQWLRLTNPAPKGTAQQVSGDLWVDDFSITSLDSGTRPQKGER